MSDLENHIKALKTELGGVVAAVSIYNTTSASFDYIDASFDYEEVIKTMHAQQIATAAQVMHLEYEQNVLLMMMTPEHYFALQLKNKSFNKIVVELSVKKFCKEYLNL